MMIINVFWCHVRHLNQSNKTKNNKKDKKLVDSLGYKDINFPVSIKNYKKSEKNNICLNVFCYEDGMTYPVHISKQKFKDCMDLLLISENNKLDYVYIKDFNRFMFNKTKQTTKKHFCRYYLQCFSKERILSKHKGV